MAAKDVALGALHDGPRRRKLKADAALDKRACWGALNVGVSLGYALRAAAGGGVRREAGSLCLLKDAVAVAGRPGGDHWHPADCGLGLDLVGDCRRAWTGELVFLFLYFAKK